MYEKHERATGFDERLAADTEGCTMMTPELARRIAELRACDNIAEIHVVTFDERQNRALVLIVPRACSGASTDSGWHQPTRARRIAFASPAHNARVRRGCQASRVGGP